jgi:hypothetical protein
MSLYLDILFDTIDLYIDLLQKGYPKILTDNIWQVIVTYSPAYATLRGGGFLLKYSNLYSINKLSPCVPRFLF